MLVSRNAIKCNRGTHRDEVCYPKTCVSEWRGLKCLGKFARRPVYLWDFQIPISRRYVSANWFPDVLTSVRVRSCGVNALCNQNPFFRRVFQVWFTSIVSCGSYQLRVAFWRVLGALNVTANSPRAWWTSFGDNICFSIRDWGGVTQVTRWLELMVLLLVPYCRYAIYIPLFLPVCIPVLLSMVGLPKYLMQRRSSSSWNACDEDPEYWRRQIQVISCSTDGFPFPFVRGCCIILSSQSW